MTTSRSKLRSLVVLAMSASHIWPRPRSSKPEEPAPCPHPTLAAKRSRRKFKIFSSKSKRTSKISVCAENVLSDDDCSSIYSDHSYSQPLVYSSVPNLSAAFPNGSWDDPPSTPILSGYKHSSIQQETLREEDEDVMKMDQESTEAGIDDLNWDSQSNDGCLETPDGCEDGQRRCSAPIPIIVPPHKKRHHRAISLPQNLIKDLPKSLYHRQPTPSESWDNDFELPEDFQVPTQVEESQVNIRMDMFNIQDFRTQVEEIKNLRTKKLSLASKVQTNLLQQKPNNFTAHKNLKIFKNLEEMYKTEWEEVNVIIDISEMAKDRKTGLEDFGFDREINRTPSGRHLDVLRKIIDEQPSHDGDDDGDDDDDDSFIAGALDGDDKENDITKFNSSPLDTVEPSSSHGGLAKKTNSLMGESSSGWGLHGLKRDHSGLLNSSQSSLAKKKRRENVRISVDEMPSLIDHLRVLQSRLLGHIVQLADLEALKYEYESSIDANIYQQSCIR